MYKITYGMDAVEQTHCRKTNEKLNFHKTNEKPS